MNLLRAASTVSLLTLASRITGLARELLIAASFGASAWTDAFNVAFRIPNLLRRLFAEGAFSQAFVPILAGTRERDGETATHALVDAVATALAAVLFVTCVVGVIAAPWFVYLLASGLTQGPGFDAAVVMTRWMFPYIGFMSLVALGAGVLNTWGRFSVPAAAPVMLNVAMIAAAWSVAHGAGDWMLAHGWQPVYLLALGVLVGGVLQLVTIGAGLAHLGILPRIGLGLGAVRAAFAYPGTRRVLRQMTPALLGVSVAQLSLLINTQIASHLAPGSVSWLSYADRLMEFPTALLGVALGVVLLPQLSAAQAGGHATRYSALLDWGLRLVLLLSLPCAVGLLVFPEPVVAILYHYGRFAAQDVYQTQLALMGYGVGLVGLVAIKVLAPGFYAQQDIRTPVRIAVVVLVATQCFNLVLVPRLAHAGLALSIGLGALMNAGWLCAGLVRRGSYRPAPGWGRFLAQLVLANLVVAAFLYVCAGQADWVALRATPWLRIARVGGVLAAAVALYFTVLALARCRLGELLRPPHGPDAD